jgi:hypothetical protein
MKEDRKTYMHMDGKRILQTLEEEQQLNLAKHLYSVSVLRRIKLEKMGDTNKFGMASWDAWPSTAHPIPTRVTRAAREGVERAAMDHRVSKPRVKKLYTDTADPQSDILLSQAEAGMTLEEDDSSSKRARDILSFEIDSAFERAVTRRIYARRAAGEKIQPLIEPPIQLRASARNQILATVHNVLDRLSGSQLGSRKLTSAPSRSGPAKETKLLNWIDVVSDDVCVRRVLDRCKALFVDMPRNEPDIPGFVTLPEDEQRRVDMFKHILASHRNNEHTISEICASETLQQAVPSSVPRNSAPAIDLKLRQTKRRAAKQSGADSLPLDKTDVKLRVAGARSSTQQSYDLERAPSDNMGTIQRRKLRSKSRVKSLQESSNSDLSQSSSISMSPRPPVGVVFANGDSDVSDFDTRAAALSSESITSDDG